jgi:hypothetical protein
MDSRRARSIGLVSKGHQQDEIPSSDTVHAVQRSGAGVSDRRQPPLSSAKTGNNSHPSTSSSLFSRVGKKTEDYKSARTGIEDPTPKYYRKDEPFLQVGENQSFHSSDEGKCLSLSIHG